MGDEASGLMETRLHDAGFERVAGCDEVGRGALAGPLVAAAVVLPPEAEIEGLKDSKLCTKLQLRRLDERIREVAFALSIVRVHPWTIDKDGLNPANIKALRHALKGLETEPDYVLVDAFRLRRLRWPSLAVKKGDVVSRNVAAASIVAKVHRDRAMRRYAKRYKHYGFASNVGYGTRYHWKALEQYGPCAIHRRSFFGVVGFPDDSGVIRPHAARDLEPRSVLEEEMV